ncbi:MAG: hypothetical protein AB1806_16290 [Acidobacteriota bacterium]
MKHLLSRAGLSLVEVTVVLSALALVAGTLTPASLDLVQRAKDLQASRDALSIRDAIVRLLDDAGAVRIGTRGTEGAIVELLVSGGATPASGDAGDWRWTRPVGADGLVDLLDRHLVTNEPGGSPANAWRGPARAGDLGWRGAYTHQGIGADPWGRRYAVNVQFLLGRNEVIVLSAGPNGIIETPFEGRGLTGGGDDRVALIK